MRREFLVCLEGMMNSTMVSIKNELDIISANNPVHTDDHRPDSYMVKFIKYIRNHINTSESHKNLICVRTFIHIAVDQINFLEPMKISFRLNMFKNTRQQI